MAGSYYTIDTVNEYRFTASVGDKIAVFNLEKDMVPGRLWGCCRESVFDLMASDNVKLIGVGVVIECFDADTCFLAAWRRIDDR